MRCLISIGVLCMLTALHAQDADSKQELKRLEGDWVRISFVADGQSGKDGDRSPDKQVKLKIQGNQFHDRPFTIDSTKTPKHIDLEEQDSNQKTIVIPGIYELKGDELKVCFPFPFEGKYDQPLKRPVNFTPQAGENHVVEVYRRKSK